MFDNYDSLAFYNKFYYKNNQKFVIENKFNEILKKRDKTNIIDSTALIELVNKNYMFSDRTLVKNIYRTPWMSKPNLNMDGWDRKVINAHSNKIISEEKVAHNLFELLKKEIKIFCENKENVGIFLSGGMDSRIIAGVLYELIREKEIKANIVAITWGIENSRDVVYAERLAKSLKWEWIHLKLSSENLVENIQVTAELGCEFSPVHLHAMPKVRNLEGIDCILAASYGDSIGRAEYSGNHVTKLKPIDQKLINRYGIFQNNLFKEDLNKAHQDIKDYHKKYPQKMKLAEYELDLQHHYMRRQLNPCMSYINEKIPVYQAFTSPEIYEYMWSVNPKNRNDSVYKYIIEMLDDTFNSLPWSKTGKIYMGEDQTSDNFSKQHNMYGEWIRNDLNEIIKEKVLSNNIDKLNIFNMDVLNTMLKVNKEKSNLKKHSRIDELLIWIAALSDCTDLYNIKSDIENYKPSGLKDKLLSKVEINSYIYLKNMLNNK